MFTKLAKIEEIFVLVSIKIGTLLSIFKFLRIFYVISVLLLIHIVTTLIIIAMLYSVVRCIL